MRTFMTALVLTSIAAPAAAQDAIATRFREAVRTVAERRIAYQGGQERHQEVERTTRTVRVGASGVLDVSNIAGDITITRGGGSDATIDIVKTARGRSPADAQELLRLVQVEVAERASRAEVRTRYPDSTQRRENRRNFNVAVAFNITAPQGTRLIVNSISGNIAVKDIKGDLALKSISGNVRIQNGGRVSAAESASGNIEITDTSFDGGLTVSSISGNVVLRQVKARRIDAESVSGNVVLENVESDRVEANSVSGNATFTGALARGGQYELNSHSGEIRVGIGGGTGFTLEASTFSGSVRSEFALNGREAEPVVRRRQRSLEGTYGDGSAALELTTFSGSIVISKR